MVRLPRPDLLLVVVTSVFVVCSEGLIVRRNDSSPWKSARRSKVYQSETSGHRSTSSTSEDRKAKSADDEDTPGTSLSISGNYKPLPDSMDNIDLATTKKPKEYVPVSSESRRGWRKWHRKCMPCHEDMYMIWKNPGIAWICGSYQRARRSFKSECSMRLRNCQDGTMFVKIHNHRCEDDPYHGKHFFYEYLVFLSDDSRTKFPDYDSNRPWPSSSISTADAGGFRRNMPRTGVLPAMRERRVRPGAYVRRRVKANANVTSSQNLPNVTNAQTPPNDTNATGIKEVTSSSKAYISINLTTRPLTNATTSSAQSTVSSTQVAPSDRSTGRSIGKLIINMNRHDANKVRRKPFVVPWNNYSTKNSTTYTKPSSSATNSMSSTRIALSELPSVRSNGELNINMNQNDGNKAQQPSIILSNTNNTHIGTSHSKPFIAAVQNTLILTKSTSEQTAIRNTKTEATGKPAAATDDHNITITPGTNATNHYSTNNGTSHSKTFTMSSTLSTASSTQVAVSDRPTGWSNGELIIDIDRHDANKVQPKTVIPSDNSNYNGTSNTKPSSSAQGTMSSTYIASSDQPTDRPSGELIINMDRHDVNKEEQPSISPPYTNSIHNGNSHTNPVFAVGQYTLVLTQSTSEQNATRNSSTEAHPKFVTVDGGQNSYVVMRSKNTSRADVMSNGNLLTTAPGSLPKQSRSATSLSTTVSLKGAVGQYQPNLPYLGQYPWLLGIRMARL